MPVIVSIRSAGTGQFFTCNGKLRAGAWRFQRNPQKTELHELRFATAAEFNAVSEDILCAQGNPPMVVTVIPEEAPADTELKEQLSKVSAERESLSVSMSQLQQKLAEAEAKLEQATGTGPSEQEKRLLADYDTVLDLLSPHAKQDENPVDVVRRILSEALIAEAAEPVEAEPPEGIERAPEDVDPLAFGYEELLRYAKSELGLTFEKKPSKAVLEQQVKEKLGRV